VSERRAGLEKELVAEADPPEFRGRPMPLGETATAPSGSVGVMASACLEEEIDETREALGTMHPMIQIVSVGPIGLWCVQRRC
jgi:hypothetical protein